MSVKISHTPQCKNKYLIKKLPNKNLQKEIVGLLVPSDLYKDTLLDALEILSLPNKFIINKTKN